MTQDPPVLQEEFAQFDQERAGCCMAGGVSPTYSLTNFCQNFPRRRGFTKSKWIEGLEEKKAEDFRALFVVQYQSAFFNRTQICAATRNDEDRVSRKV